MRTASLSLILAAGLATAAQAQAPATAPPATAQPAPATPPRVTGPATPALPTTPATPATPAAPAAPPPAAAPQAPAAPSVEAPTLPTTGDGAAVISVLERICVPMVRGGALDQLAPAAGLKKNRRDGTWSAPLGGGPYVITVMPQGVNRDVCQAEVHFAVGQDAAIAKAINVWAFLHKPELIPTANYVAVDADNVKRIRRSWEHQESAASVAVNFTTWRKPDDSPLNRGFDTGMLFYQERKF